jgi:hypothetical protein
MVCLRNIRVDTLHNGDIDYDDDNDNNNNNNLSPFDVLSISLIGFVKNIIYDSTMCDIRRND